MMATAMMGTGKLYRDFTRNMLLGFIARNVDVIECEIKDTFNFWVKRQSWQSCWRACEL